MLVAGFDQNVLVLIYETGVYEMRVNELDLVKLGRVFYLIFFFLNYRPQGYEYVEKQ